MAKILVQIELPSELIERARFFVAEGWADGFDELVAEALWRFLETHSWKAMGAFVKEDVEWGLHGSD